MIVINDCVVCGVGCCWIPAFDGVLAEKRVCSPECLAQLESRPTKYAPDVAYATSAKPDSGLESVPAVESDIQPRG
jgi:hypothetical protein